MKKIDNPPPLPPRPVDGHKGLFGRVLVVGGSESMIGAPTLAGRAALKLGAGLVQIAVPRSILGPALMITPELIGLPLGRAASSTKDQLLPAAEKADAIVFGPGMGQSADALLRLQRLIRLENKPMVIDADGLNLLAAGKRWPSYFRAAAVLTPHPGEMKRLAKLIGRSDVPADDAGRLQIATEAANAFGQVVVLKGSRTVVVEPGENGRVYVNHTGDSSLSKAGTGDVLSGMLGALLGQKMDRFDAACLAVHLHGRAGELAGEKLGTRCVLSHDVIEAISPAVREMETAPNAED